MASSRVFGLRIAVVGSGISGLSAAWLLSRRHQVTVFEQAARLGGHSNTVSVERPGCTIPVDTGFIVFNPETYPNLTALFAHLGVPTRASDMSFAVSRHNGRLEYAGAGLASLFAQPINALKPGFWSMLQDLRRFYATAPRDLQTLGDEPQSLGHYLAHHGYGERFREDHLLPMAAAIWSVPVSTVLDYPAQSFIRFFANHGLFKLHARPAWHTVVGGSKVYVEKLTRPFAQAVCRKSRVAHVARDIHGATLRTADGSLQRFDHVVIAVHADEALAMLADPSDQERSLLGAFRYTCNRAVLHTDPECMPRRRSVWSSWNYVERHRFDGRAQVHVSYWMNRLQGLPSDIPLFVTLNADPLPHDSKILHTEDYSHPVLNLEALRAQHQLWSLQGTRNTWFCGAYFGAGFHEDGLQSGLAVAEDLGGLRRPWHVADESGRIVRGPRAIVREMEPA
ncbi:MAG: FAD-dependent oxidoreductase [Rhodospirillales bacterium]|nr:FAD-dependent oxidoreductase [Rhodospirillales bacterium]